LADEIVGRDLPWYPSREPEARFDATNLERVGAGWRMARGGGTVDAAARAAGADVVHANSVRTALGATLSTRRLVTHVRDVLPPGPTARTVKRVVAARSSRVVGISAFVADRFRSDVSRAGRWVIVDNPIDLQGFPIRDPGDRSEARLRLGFDPTVPLVLVIGQITPWKRQHLAIEAMAGVRASGIPAHLAVVGSVKFTEGRTGEVNRDYERRLHRRTRELALERAVTFAGERQDIGELLAAADVVAVPSRDEPFGRVAVEAISSGVPVLASSVGGPADVVRTYGGGVTVGEDDPESWGAGLATAVEAVRSHPPIVEPRVVGLVRDAFDADLHARIMGDVFDGVAAR
jgi:glycosyltransferase involved in cell wall biosynthesis